MPLLAPALAPPANIRIGSSVSSPELSKISTGTTGPLLLPPQSRLVVSGSADSKPQCPGGSISRVPTVRLDVDAISDSMAAHLASSLLGHVLFMKNQVPFPITQLSRIPGSQSTGRTSKLRANLLSSFDTLSSHLSTTFTALSTAFALRGTSSPYTASSNFRSASKPIAKAYISFLLGPSISTPKAKVLLGIDGLEVKVWGERYDKEYSISDDEESEGDPEPHTSDGASDADGPFSGSEESEGEDDDGSGEGRLHEPPSDPQSPPSVVEPGNCRSLPSLASAPAVLSAGSNRSIKTPALSPPPAYTYAEEQQALRFAERLLSRTLVSLSTDDPSSGMSCEMAPTHTHILLRAPRRFNHPAWVPRQNLSSSLENMLDSFLNETSTSTNTKGVKVEGVWLKCREDWEDITQGDTTCNEGDEMIWWSWDGKIVGFSGW